MVWTTLARLFCQHCDWKLLNIIEQYWKNTENNQHLIDVTMWCIIVSSPIKIGIFYQLTCIGNHCDCDCDVQREQKYYWPVIVLKLGSCWKCLFDRDLQLNLTKLAKIRFHHRTILNGEIKRFSEHLEITIQFFGNIKSCKIKFFSWWFHI